jgi:hypothetical protein
MNEWLNTSCDLCVVFASTLRFRQVTLYPLRVLNGKRTTVRMLCVCVCVAGLPKQNLHIYPNLLPTIKRLAGWRRNSQLALQNCFARNVHFVTVVHSCGIISEWNRLMNAVRGNEKIDECIARMWRWLMNLVCGGTNKGEVAVLVWIKG